MSDHAQTPFQYLEDRIAALEARAKELELTFAVHGLCEAKQWPERRIQALRMIEQEERRDFALMSDSGVECGRLTEGEMRNAVKEAQARGVVGLEDAMEVMTGKERLGITFVWKGQWANFKYDPK